MGSRRPWTTREVATLRANANLGARYLAHELGRTKKAIYRKAEREGIQIRTVKLNEKEMCAECHIYPIGWTREQLRLGLCELCSRKRRNRELELKNELLKEQQEKSRLTTAATKMRNELRARGEEPVA